MVQSKNKIRKDSYMIFKILNLSHSHSQTPSLDYIFNFRNSFQQITTDPDSSSTPSAAPRKNIFFVKTHKTASSTVQNILMRFGFHHSLNFMLPSYDCYLGYLHPIREKDMNAKSIPADRKFNIFAHHTRYRLDTNRFLYPDTVRVTILRDPAELFESVFHYFNLSKDCNMSLRQLINNLPSANDVDFFNYTSQKRIHGRNQMSRDLGLEMPHNRSYAEILDFIRFVDSQFHLVMITEYMEASLVLLADLMRWPLHYVSYFSQNVRKNTSKTVLSETDRFVLSQYNFADHLLYDHFLENFRERVVEYGFEQMSAAIQELHLINAKLKHRCVTKENYEGFKNTKSYDLRDPLDWECAYSTKRQIEFSNELREKQIERLELVRKLEYLIKSGSNRRDLTWRMGALAETFFRSKCGFLHSTSFQNMATWVCHGLSDDCWKIPLTRLEVERVKFQT